MNFQSITKKTPVVGFVAYMQIKNYKVSQGVRLDFEDWGPRTLIKIINSEISNPPIQISRSPDPTSLLAHITDLHKYIAKTFQILLFSKVLCVLMYVSCTTNVLDALPSFFLNFSSLLYFNLTKYKAFCSRNLKYLMLLWLQKIGPAPLNLKVVFTIEFSEKRASYKIQHRYIGATILNSGLAKNK